MCKLLIQIIQINDLSAPSSNVYVSSSKISQIFQNHKCFSSGVSPTSTVNACRLIFYYVWMLMVILWLEWFCVSNVFVQSLFKSFSSDKPIVSSSGQHSNPHFPIVKVCGQSCKGSSSISPSGVVTITIIKSKRILFV